MANQRPHRTRLYIGSPVKANMHIITDDALNCADTPRWMCVHGNEITLDKQRQFFFHLDIPFAVELLASFQIFQQCRCELPSVRSAAVPEQHRISSDL